MWEKHAVLYSTQALQQLLAKDFLGKVCSHITLSQLHTYVLPMTHILQKVLLNVARKVVPAVKDCFNKRQLNTSTIHIGMKSTVVLLLCSLVGIWTGARYLGNIEQPDLGNIKQPAISFGTSSWKQYFGDVGVEPPLPHNIHEILESPCPFFVGKKVKDTHLLTLVPQTVEGKALTLDYLSKLIQNPKSGYKTRYSYYSHYVKWELGSSHAPLSHWVLMTKDVILESRNKTYNQQKELVATTAKKANVSYRLPTALEAVTSILMEHRFPIRDYLLTQASIQHPLHI